MVHYWSFVLLGVVVLIAAVTDVRAGRIYNVLTYPAIAVGLIGHALVGGLDGVEGDVGFWSALGGLGLGFVPMFFACLAGGINGGDVKLMGAVGALLGWQLTLAAVVYTLAAGAALAVLAILYRKMFLRTFRRIGLFLWQVMSMHKPVDPAAADSPKIPFGLAICAGTLAAMAQSVFCPGACPMP